MITEPVDEMALRGAITGRVIARGEPDYDEARAVWNGMIDRQPLLIVRAATVDDVGYQVGYEDPTFFRRLFRRAIGLTPAAYRRKYATIVPLPVAGAGSAPAIEAAG